MVLNSFSMTLLSDEYKQAIRIKNESALNKELQILRNNLKTIKRSNPPRLNRQEQDWLEQNKLKIKEKAFSNTMPIQLRTECLLSTAKE